MAIWKKQLKKNRLDLEFHGESQKINAYLILLTTGLLAFLGTFLWLKDSILFYYGIAITFTIAVTFIWLYVKSRKKMDEILAKIEKL